MASGSLDVGGGGAEFRAEIDLIVLAVDFMEALIESATAILSWLKDFLLSSRAN